MNYLDLFSGIGGFALGISRHNKLGKHYFSEIDKYAISIYKRHFPDAIPVGDVSKVSGSELGKIDLITFGFPCQDLSIAGKRAGIGGSRSGLFFEAVRLIRELRPSIFIFENVKGLLTSNRGQDFETVLREIADIGIYECEWQLLNTSWFLPQNRERVYFIGHLGEGSGGKVFPISGYDGSLNEGLQGYCTQTLTTRTGSTAKQQTVVAVLAPDREEKRQNGRRMKEDGEPSLDTQMQQYTMIRDGRDNRSCLRSGRTLEVGHKGMSIRRLTPVECERLQGFPDGWTEFGEKGEKISDSQRYKCLGNAVTVNVVEEIAKRLF